jgi:hypothetical protein
MLWAGHLQTSLCLLHDTFSDAFDFTLHGREEGSVSQSEYFHWEDQQGISWSIQAQGTLPFSSFRYPGPYQACPANAWRCLNRTLPLAQLYG